MPAAASFKHVSPAGAAVGVPLSEIEVHYFIFLGFLILWVNIQVYELSMIFILPQNFVLISIRFILSTV